MTHHPARRPPWGAVRILLAGAMLAGWLVPRGSLRAQDLPIEPAKISRAEPVDFADEILPLLKQNCVACHHDKQAEGGLVLQSHAGLMKGGLNGPGIVPGDVEASHVFARASGRSEPLMPPEGNSVGAEALTPKELALLQLWIQQGAPGSEQGDGDSLQWQPIPAKLSPIYAVASSPDGRFVASGNANRVTIYDAASMKPIEHLADPELSSDDRSIAGRDIVQSIAFSPDGQTVATGGFRTVRLWQRTGRQLSTTNTPFANAAGPVAANGDGSRVAVVNAIGDIELWDPEQSARISRLAGHDGRIEELAWAAGTDRLVSVDETGVLRLWQPEPQKELLQVSTGASPAGLAVSADARYVAIVDSDRQVHLWSINEQPDGGSDQDAAELVAQRLSDTDDALKPLLATDGAAAIAFAPTPVAHLAIATQAGNVLVVDLAAKAPVRTFEHGSPLTAIAIGGTPLRLVSAAEDGTTQLWDFQSGKAVAELGHDPQRQFARDAAERDAARQQAHVKRLTEQQAELQQRVKSETEAAAKAKELRDQAAAELKTAQEKLDAAKASLAKTQSAIEQTEQAIEAAENEKEANEQKLAQAEKPAADAEPKETDGEALKKRIDALKKQVEAGARQLSQLTAKLEKQKQELAKQQKQAEQVGGALSKHQQTLAERKQALAAAEQARQQAEAAVAQQTILIASEQRRARTLQQRLAEWERSLRASKTRPFVAGTFAGDSGERIVMAAADGTVRSFRTADGTALDQFQLAEGIPQGLLSVADHRLLVSGAGGSAQLWSLRPGWELVQTIASPTETTISDRVTAIDFHPGGQAIAVGSGPPSRSGEVKIFAVPSGDVLQQWNELHSDTVLGVQFSPDGRTLASAAADKTIRLLGVSDGQTQQSLEGHSHHVLAVAWQADGQTIASASADQTVKVWDAESGQQIRTIQGFPKEITALKFVGQGSQIATACADGQVRLHDAANGQAIRSFQAGGDFLFTADVIEPTGALVAGGQSGVLRCWALSDGKLRHELAAE